MDRKDEWNEMANNSKRLIEDFNDFYDDKAIVWADNELNNYKRAMMILIQSNNDWAMSLSDDDKRFIQTMINRAES